MFRSLTMWIIESCLLLGLGIATGLMALPTHRETLSALGPEGRPCPGEDRRPGLFMRGAIAADVERDATAGHATEPELTWLTAGRVTVVVHGVNDDGTSWSPRIRNVLMQSPYGDSRQEVYLFRWTQPDGRAPAMCQARNSLARIEARFPDDPAAEAGYQVDESRRLRDFLAGARTLYSEYGVEGKIDIVAHSQGTLITLKALEQGCEVDNVVFLGSPLSYLGDRQDDVIAALPHVRGVLYNYYTPSDSAVRFMGGGFLYAPRGWPDKNLSRAKVVQIGLDVQGHTGYYTEECIRANYLDKLGMRGGQGCLVPAKKAREFMEQWAKLKTAARLIDPQ